MIMEPEEGVGLLLSRVTAVRGNGGTLFNDTVELWLMDTARASELLDPATMHFQKRGFLRLREDDSDRY